MIYSRKDILADLLLFMVIGLVGSGAYYLFKPSFVKITKALSDKQPAGPAAEGAAFDDRGSMETLDGRTVPLSSLKGKVIFINFWATWCGPCMMELPSIEKLYARFKDSDAVFICLSDEDSRYLKNFVEKHKLQVPIYRSENRAGFLQVAALPTTFIVSRSGKIALSRAGAAQWDKKKVVDLMTALLAEKAAGAE